MNSEAIAKPLFTKLDLRHLILPLIIEQALAFSIGVVDTVMVASVGESAVSGVSLVDAINFLLVTLFTALATGGAIVAGQYLGMKEPGSAKRAAKHLLLVALLVSLLVTVLCLCFNQPILHLLFGRVEADVMHHASTYFYITALSYPFIAVYNAAAALFRTMGNGKVPMLNSLVMNVINIIGNCIFIFGLGWGVLGAAIATLISRIIAAVSIMAMLRRPSLEANIRSYSLRNIEADMIKRILRIGIPTGLENSVFQLGRLVMTNLITTFGTAAVAANAVGVSLSLIGIIPGQAIGLAILTVVARCMGAGEEAQARHYVRIMMRKAWIYMLLLNVGLMLLIVPTLSLYKLSAETYALAFWILILHGSAAIAVWVPSFTLPNALRAAGDARFTMIVSIASMFIFRVGCSYLLAELTDLGVWCIWISMAVDWTVRGLCFTLRWKSGKWKSKVVIEAKQHEKRRR